MSTIRIRVLYFALARDLTGTSFEEIDLPTGATLGELRDRLGASHPRLAEHADAMAWAVGTEFAVAGYCLESGDEVAVLPPVSGGSGALQGAESAIVVLTHEPIAVDAAREALAEFDAGRGAIATFSGLVRDNSLDREVVHLDYEAYEPMAVAEMRRIANEALAKYPLRQVAVVHRLGHLELGHVAVSIAVSSAHRAEAFDGCRYVIEELKKRVPIWKKETAPEGETWWGRGP